MRILITGGTGFVGRRLCDALLQHGHELTVLSRNATSARGALPAAVKTLTWAPDHQAKLEIPEGTDAVVNLAGESIASGRWTDERKKRIRESRVRMTGALVDAMRDSSARPAVLVNASAIGYYGPRGDEELTEDAAPGRGFLTDVVLEWEQCAREAEALGVRVVLMRLGIVLGREAGALPQMSMPFRLFVGGPVASGQQWMSWIHVDDVVGMIVWALEQPSVSGPINTVAPAPLRNVDISTAIGRALGRPSWLPAPAFALNLLFGEMADALLVNGQRVVPARALAQGYAFKYPEVDGALREALT